MELILTNNTVSFDNSHFEQIKGNAMGTRVAPTYVTLTLLYLQELLYHQIEEKWGLEYSVYITNMWKRFLDDCFIVWKDDDQKLTELKEMLNAHNYSTCNELKTIIYNFKKKSLETGLHRM